MADQNQLIQTMFGDSEIRILDGGDDDMWIPIVDISSATGYGNDQLNTMLSRNTELFEGFNRNITMMSPAGNVVSYKCVNEQGFYMLLSKISLNQLKDESIKATLIEFNRWMVNEIKRLRTMKGTINRPMTPGEYFKDQMTVANIMHEFLGLDKTLLTTAVITSTEKNTGADFTELKYMLPPVEGIIAVYTATQIGKFFGKEGRDVNLILKELDLHEKINKVWTLTEKGKLYGKPYFEAVEHENNSKWSGIINKWNPDTVELVRDYIESK